VLDFLNESSGVKQTSKLRARSGLDAVIAKRNNLRAMSASVRTYRTLCGR